MNRSPQSSLSDIQQEKSPKLVDEDVRKCVSFDSCCDEFPTISLDDYSDEEHAACFFNDYEYDIMTRECLRIINKMTKGQKISSKKDSKRGLERMTPKAQEAKDANKLRAFIAVLETQDRQLAEGYNDPEEIALKYRKACGDRCREYAAKVGARDARSASTYNLEALS
eukprot:scaffold672_cov126-Cylindrotheca_fusiformis.AAC.48